jgi:hypothetical protein
MLVANEKYVTSERLEVIGATNPQRQQELKALFTRTLGGLGSILAWEAEWDNKVHEIAGLVKEGKVPLAEAGEAAFGPSWCACEEQMNEFLKAVCEEDGDSYTEYEIGDAVACYMFKGYIETLQQRIEAIVNPPTEA